MRYLFLSVLVVCVIGVMVPSVFANHSKEMPCHDANGFQLECPETWHPNIPLGVKFPAPNFESEFSDGTWWDTKDGLTIGELYANWYSSLEHDPGFIKIVSGDGKDMLLYYVTIDCSECTEPWEDKPQNYLMYDGKDRKFEPITSSILNWNDNIVENPNFSWSEDCSPLPVTVQPGIIDRMKVCFEIPKNSDHFKFTDSSLGYTYVIALFDRSGTIFTLTEVRSGEETISSIPEWVKNNAGWWIEGKISDTEFTMALQYLVKTGIITVNLTSV